MAYSDTYECDAAAFRGLTNPVTGEPVKVMMVVRSDRPPRFFAPDTYSPASPHPPGSRLLERCPWTGRTLSRVVDGEGMTWLLGGFNPHAPLPREEFLYYMRMRDGVSELPPPESARVEPVEERAPMPTHHEPKMLEGSEKEAEDILKKSGFQTERKTTVRVTGKAGKRR